VRNIRVLFVFRNYYKEVLHSETRTYDGPIYPNLAIQAREQMSVMWWGFWSKNYGKWCDGKGEISVLDFEVRESY
jgi:hypothetical protein